MYTNTKGETSIRFTNYGYSNQTDIEVEIKVETEKEFMNIEIIQEGYEVDEALQEVEIRYRDNKNITFKCKGCRTGSMGIVEVERHFKTCKFRTNNLGYREDYNNQDEIESNSIIGKKELMESTSSSASPFQRT
ncbi:hypothetical protein MTR67_016396, partial [Solanum verrucosum]